MEMVDNADYDMELTQHSYTHIQTHTHVYVLYVYVYRIYIIKADHFQLSRTHDIRLVPNIAAINPSMCWRSVLYECFCGHPYTTLPSVATLHTPPCVAQNMRAAVGRRTGQALTQTAIHIE